MSKQLLHALRRQLQAAITMASRIQELGQRTAELERLDEVARAFERGEAIEYRKPGPKRLPDALHCDPDGGT